MFSSHQELEDNENAMVLDENNEHMEIGTANEEEVRAHKTPCLSKMIDNAALRLESFDRLKREQGQ